MDHLTESTIKDLIIFLETSIQNGLIKNNDKISYRLIGISNISPISTTRTPSHRTSPGKKLPIKTSPTCKCTPKTVRRLVQQNIKGR